MAKPFYHTTLPFIIFCITICSVTEGYSQNIAISFKDFKNHVTTSNRSVLIAATDIEISKAEASQSNSLYLPNITASYTGITTTNPLMAFGSKLNQEILTQNDFSPALLNNPDRISHYTTKIEIQQPLINIDGLHKRKAALASLKATELNAIRTKDQLKLTAYKMYMQLQLAYKTIGVQQKSLETVQENLALTKQYLKQGLLQQSDVLAVEIQVNDIKNKLSSSKNAIQNISNSMANLMGVVMGDTFIPSEELVIATDVSDPNSEVPETRSDFQALKNSTEAYLQMYKSEKTGFLPRLNAFGTYEFHDGDFLGTQAKGYLLGAQLSWNVFNGNKRIGKIKKTKTQYEKSILKYEDYKSQSQLALEKSMLNLADLKNQLATRQLGIAQSKEVLRILQNRYQQGLEKTTDVLRAETQFSQKQLQYHQAVFNHNYTLAIIKFLTN